MGNLSTFFNFKGSIGDEVVEFPNIFPLEFNKADFIQVDTASIYSKILIDTIERTHGLSQDQLLLLWDNCLMSASRDGLITTLSGAMVDKKELFLVYVKSVNVVRQATGSEIMQIKRDYERQAQSKIGVYISFKNYKRSDMVKLYSGLEYDTIASLNKSMNLSRAIQVKMSDLRASVSLSDSGDVKLQAKQVADSLSKGKDVLLDSKDSIETSKIDLTSTKESISFLESKRCFYLGMPSSYVSGEQTGGIGSTGENDTKSVERGLKAYYFSIVKPVLESLFAVKLIYKSQDFRQIKQALEAMQTFDLVSEEYVSRENKKKIIESLLDLESSDNNTDVRLQLTEVNP